MDTFQVIILALIQGLTEFLPHFKFGAPYPTRTAFRLGRPRLILRCCREHGLIIRRGDLFSQ